LTSGSELSDRLADLLGAEQVQALQRLSGGASRETWSFDARLADGRTHELILRRDPPDEPQGMAVEAQCLRAATGAGVPVPEVMLASDDASLLGSPFIVMERLAGETIARRILRDEAFRQARQNLVTQLGRAAARIHSIDPGGIEGLPEEDPLAKYRTQMDELGQPHPAFELAFRWLEERRPATTGSVLVHGDLRLGNLIVGEQGLVAVLDWELAHRGDPLEDLGWLCVKAWRFGGPRPVAGVAGYDELLAAYEAAGGPAVDRHALHWWETLGTLKWGVMTIWQADRHLRGAVRSVELAAIGRRVCENEWDVLDCLEAAPA
jgi:aminoglycoside phosphotransferase (APT) family kinase protein